MTGLNGAVATSFYNAQTLILLVHAFLPFPPLLAASDAALRWGDRFQDAQTRTDQTRGTAPWGKDHR